MLYIKENVLLAPYTTFHIGGPADYFVIVQTLDGLKEAIAWAKNPSFTPGVEGPLSTPDVEGPNTSGVRTLPPLPYFLLGAGANILVGDKGYRGLVIKNECKKIVISSEVERSPKNKISPRTSFGRNDRANTFLTAESGATVESIIEQTAKLGLSGLEDFAGIVSTVGGALWQNLHFLSPDRSKTVYIADILQSATILHENNSTEEVDRAYFHFGYDTSILHTKKDIVMAATFLLTPKNPDEIQKIIDANLQWRAEKHPPNAENCSAGSIFKKIEGYGAGRLIQQVGLKGKQIGGAQISPVHANFIVNTGGATAADVRSLIQLVQKTVQEKLHLNMEVEISFVGEF